MAWEMVQKYVPPHVCKIPYSVDGVSDIAKNDIIKCTECEQHYKCTERSVGGDQRDGSTWTTLEWTKIAFNPLPVMQGFSGIYAPGTK